MDLYLTSLKRQWIPAAIMGVVYGISLMTMIYICNSNSVIAHEISPYEYGSDWTDFFLPLLVSVPFGVGTYYLKKDNFLDYISLRVSGKDFLKAHIKAAMTMCLVTVFAVNMIGIFFSIHVAEVSPEYRNQQDLSEFLLGSLQQNHIVLFGFIWSAYKGVLCSMICLLEQIFALYLNNLFLSLLGPFVYIVLENYVTGIFGIPQISFTTALVLNRLDPATMGYYHIVIEIGIFLLAIFLIEKMLRRNDEKQY